jgi:DNA-directed RNA polymerase delta subunit
LTKLLLAVIIRVGDEWALAEWYPNNPNLRKRTADKVSKKKSKKKATKKTSTASAPTGASSPAATMTNGDAIAKVLSEADMPLHVKDIAEGIKKHGKTATARSLPGTMIQDSKKRFVNVGENFWVLSAWPVSKRVRPLKL